MWRVTLTGRETGQKYSYEIGMRHNSNQDKVIVAAFKAHGRNYTAIKAGDYAKIFDVKCDWVSNA